MAIFVGALLAGCRTAAPAPRSIEVTIPGPQPPHAIVYGDLFQLWSEPPGQSALQEWLLGPAGPRAPLLRNPQGMTLLDESLLVCDQGRPAVVSIDLATGRAALWGERDNRPQCPVDVKFDGQDRVYVADPTRRAVLVYDRDGRWIEELVLRDPQAAFRPVALLVHAGVLYVGNVAAGRVERWDVQRREWLDPLTPPESGGVGSAPTGLAAGPNELLLVADALQGRIHRWSHEGRWLAPLGGPGRAPGELVRPKQVCCTPAGQVWVSDAGRQSVVVYDAGGEFLWEIHEQPPEWSGLTLPAGVLAVPGSQLRSAADESSPLRERLADECVLVSDALGRVSLTVLCQEMH